MNLELDRSRPCRIRQRPLAERGGRHAVVIEPRELGQEQPCTCPDRIPTRARGVFGEPPGSWQVPGAEVMLSRAQLALPEQAVLTGRGQPGRELGKFSCRLGSPPRRGAVGRHVELTGDRLVSRLSPQGEVTRTHLGTVVEGGGEQAVSAPHLARRCVGKHHRGNQRVGELDRVMPDRGQSGPDRVRQGYLDRAAVGTQRLRNAPHLWRRRHRGRKEHRARAGRECADPFAEKARDRLRQRERVSKRS